MDWLSQIYFVGLALAALLGPTFAILIVIIGIKKRAALSRVSPLTTDLLRSPGFSLQQEIGNMHWDLMEYLLMIPVLTAIVPMLFFIQAKILDQPLTAISWVPVIILIILCVAYYAHKILKQTKRLSHLYLGYACEMAVGQELEQVVRPTDRPYRVFHDIPFEGFNIDHLIVTPKGVFVIETKGRSKPLHNGIKQFKVRVESDALHFPRHVEREPILQTQRNVKTAQKWLSDATGFNVPVGGILVISGWYIELKQKMVLPYVMNSSQLSSQLPSLYAGTLDIGQVQAIAYQITQRVKDVNRTRVDRLASQTIKNY